MTQEIFPKCKCKLKLSSAFYDDSLYIYPRRSCDIITNRLASFETLILKLCRAHSVA